MKKIRSIEEIDLQAIKNNREYYNSPED